jgi:hypothetical protein
MAPRRLPAAYTDTDASFATADTGTARSSIVNASNLHIFDPSFAVRPTQHGRFFHGTTPENTANQPRCA